MDFVDLAFQNEALAFFALPYTSLHLLNDV